MSASEDPEPEHADAYRTLADRIQDAEQSEVWNAFGRKMDTLARDPDDRAVAGFVVNVSTDLIGTDAPLRRVISLSYRQFGDSRESLQRNAVGRGNDVYAIRSTSASNPVETARQSVVTALRDAANGGPSVDSE